MLPIIHAGIERGKIFRRSSPWVSHSLITATTRRLCKGDPLAMDPLEVVALDGPEKLTYICTLLASEEKEQLRHVLLGNKDIFTWSHSDMTEIDPTLAFHKLNVIATKKPVK